MRHGRRSRRSPPKLSHARSRESWVQGLGFRASGLVCPKGTFLRATYGLCLFRPEKRTCREQNAHTHDQNEINASVLYVLSVMPEHLPKETTPKNSKGTDFQGGYCLRLRREGRFRIILNSTAEQQLGAKRKAYENRAPTLQKHGLLIRGP